MLEHYKTEGEARRAGFGKSRPLPEHKRATKWGCTGCRLEEPVEEPVRVGISRGRCKCGAAIIARR
jgi:hypothetical protein